MRELEIGSLAGHQLVEAVRSLAMLRGQRGGVFCQHYQLMATLSIKARLQQRSSSCLWSSRCYPIVRLTLVLDLLSFLTMQQSISQYDLAICVKSMVYYFCSYHHICQIITQLRQHSKISRHGLRGTID